MMVLGVLLGFVLGAILIALVLGARLAALSRGQPLELGRLLDEKHRAMLNDLHAGLAAQGDRVHHALAVSADHLRGAVGQELELTRQRMEALQSSQMENLGGAREAILARMGQVLAEQGKAGQEMLSMAVVQSTGQIKSVVEQLNKTTDMRLGEISGKVSERLDEGFKKTNETFVQVMARLATIDEAQKKIDGLTTNVVSLQELLGDKRARGAFGEVQLEALVRNALPESAYAMQHTLSTGVRVDCALFLPAPTGMVAVDSKFPLENFNRMCDRESSEMERASASRLFKSDVRRHIDSIAGKYILDGETSDGAVLFLPAEAIFAEIHSHHTDLVDHAMRNRVWIVSPTTMMAVLNTARAVLKDVETRRQVHVIKESLSKLAKEFGRFDDRMRKLADHIRLAHRDAEEVCTTSRKISGRFARIERVQLEGEGDEEERFLEVAETEGEGALALEQGTDSHA